jgi:hypothetical protein
MSSRNRTCHHLVPSVTVLMPPPATLARLAPLMAILMDVAAAFDECDPDGSYLATEFIRWADIECRTAARSQGALVDDIPHGTRTGYLARGCRCEKCRAWRSAYYNVKAAS